MGVYLAEPEDFDLTHLDRDRFDSESKLKLGQYLYERERFHRSNDMRYRNLALGVTDKGEMRNYAIQGNLFKYTVDLPPGWFSKLEDDGRTSYYNTNTGESTWKSPLETYDPCQ